MRSEPDQLERDLQKALAEVQVPAPEFAVERAFASAGPALARKTAALKRARQRKKELLLLAAGYLMFLTLAALYALEYALNGWSASIVSLFAVFGGLSVLSYCCLPLFVALKPPSDGD